MQRFLYKFAETAGNFTYNTLQLEYLETYIDIHFLRWLIWLFTPIVVSFLLPVITLVLLYMSALFLRVYKHRHRLRDAYARDFWNGARQTLATLWDAHGWIWHGHEIHGMENIPDTGAALLVYYHGAIPIDYYYLMARCILQKQRVIRAVGDRFLFKIPGWTHLLEVFQVFPGSFQGCVQTLREGHLLAIAPGGVLEAQFGDENYRLIWGKRIGFAKVALEAKVPVIPIFTQNVREAFRSVSIGRKLLRGLYERTRLPVVPVYGGFPVKLRTIIGNPIPYDANITAADLAQVTAESIEGLIAQHQRIPGSIFLAMMERIFHKSKQKHV